MKRHLKKPLVSSILLVLVLGMMGRIIVVHLSEFKQLQLHNPSYLIFIGALFLLNYFLGALITRVLLKPLGVDLETARAFEITIVTGFYNYFAPFGGTAARALYLKKNHSFPFQDFLVSLGASHVLIFLSAGLFGLLALLILFLRENILNPYLWGLFTSIVLALFFIALFPLKFARTNFGLWNKGVALLEGWTRLRQNTKAISLIILLSSLQLLSSTLMLILQFGIFGENLSFEKGLFLSSVSSLSLLFSLTPGNLGIKEMIAVFFSNTLGISVANSLSTALVGRVVGIAVLFTLGPLFSWRLIKNMRQN